MLFLHGDGATGVRVLQGTYGAVQEGVEKEETSTNPEDEEVGGDGGGNRKELDAKANQVATKSQLGISEVVAGGDGGRKPRSGFERPPPSPMSPAENPDLERKKGEERL
ncbi:hypothetical protein SLEP1_g60016 [Rubroshorea leprosula]|uniref:Uncharacterized protein n=1 Tax=Rubroshorea leprosula TaxID=152421 RepID=A0AAV5MVE4_9ROSI|nr:hypothetical protein SLEP1_g60016 [Rubroshorea leprosula]